MEFITNFISEYGQLISLVVSCLMLIVLFIKTKDKKYLKEVFDLIKYRTNNGTPADYKPQEFSNFKPVYRLNKATGELEQTDEVIDIQELINSCKDVALNAVLDRFLPNVATSEEVVEANKMQDNLDVMVEAINLAETYRAKYNLDSKLSYTEIFDLVQKKSSELKSKIDNAVAIKEVVENEKAKVIEESK